MCRGRNGWRHLVRHDCHKKRPPGVGRQAGATPALVRSCRPKAFVLAPDRRCAGRPSLPSDLECFLERKASVFESQSIEPHRFLTSALAQAGLEACGRGLHPKMKTNRSSFVHSWLPQARQVLNGIKPYHRPKARYSRLRLGIEVGQ